MPVFSKRSNDNLAEAHPLLQQVMQEAIKDFDFTVIEGYRGKEEQEKAFKEKKSKARFGQSPHNFKPALAVDVMPYPDAFKAKAEVWDAMGAAILAAAERIGVKVTWGRDFKGLVDKPHFELTDWRDMT